MHTTTQFLMDTCDMGPGSAFLDIGSGLGKPAPHAALHAHAQHALGIEIAHVTWALAIRTLLRARACSHLPIAPTIHYTHAGFVRWMGEAVYLAVLVTYIPALAMGYPGVSLTSPGNGDPGANPAHGPVTISAPGAGLPFTTSMTNRPWLMPCMTVFVMSFEASSSLKGALSALLTSTATSSGSAHGVLLYVAMSASSCTSSLAADELPCPRHDW